MRWFKKAWLWLKKWWWAVVAVLLIVTGFLLRGLFTPTNSGSGKPTKPVVPKFVEVAKDKAAAADAAAMMEKAEVKAKTVEAKAELEAIAKIESPRERRKQLASFLKGI